MFLRRHRLMLALTTVVLTAVAGSAASAASTLEPRLRGSAAGQSHSPRGIAPPAGLTPAPATNAQPAHVPGAWSAKALGDKAKADAGFRSPNQKPVATEIGAPGPAKKSSQTLATTFPAITDNGFVPPDPIMAAGPSNIVLAVNAHVAVYSKVGTQISQQALSDLFSAEGQVAQDAIFDPWVVYDPYVLRFWLLVLSSHDNPNRATMLLAVSRTSDATAGWNTFSLDATLNGNDRTENWCDRDTLGFDTQAIYLTCNMYAFADHNDFQYAKIRVMTKGQFLSGSCCKWWDFWDLHEGFLGRDTSTDIRPARMLGATDADGMYLVDAHGAGGSDDTLEVFHITNPGNCCGDNQRAPDLDQNGRGVGDFDPAPNVRQQGTSATLIPGDTRLLYAFWKGGHLSTGQNLACPDVGAACVAYTEIDVSKYPDMSVVNDFVVAPDASVDRFYPAADPNSAGDKAMVFSVSGPNRFAGTTFGIIPRSSECTNCFRSETTLESGKSPYGNSGQQRWGDYSGASADPDGDGVWVYGEFADTNGQWGTQVALTMDRKPTSITYTGPLGADAGATIQLSANLVEATGGSPAPLGDAPITFFVGTQVCSATTDAAGRAVCSVTLDQPNGAVEVEAIYPGDPDRMPSKMTQRFVIGAGGRAAVALTYTGPTRGEFQATANLSARLVDPRDGSGIVARNITFTVGAQSCTAMTDQAGTARCPPVLQQRPGAYTVTASFPGDAVFAPATVSAPFTIDKGRTTTTLTSSRNPSDFGQDVTFTATVTAVNRGAVAPGGSVAFRRSIIGLGSRGIDRTGRAVLTVPILQVGRNDITAAYGGDDFFLGSSAALTQIVTCSRTLTGTQSGGLDLTAGSTCLVNATVNGRITIGAGAAVSISDSRLNGSVTATDGLAFTLCGSTANGDLRVSGSAKLVLVGDGGDDGTPACAGSTLNGNTTIFRNRGQAEVGGNTISDNLVLNDSSGTGPDEETVRSKIEANTIHGGLFCTGNVPAPTDDGRPNTIDGGSFGQCTGF